MNRLISRKSAEDSEDGTRPLSRPAESRTREPSPEAIVELHNLQHAAQQALLEPANTEFQALQEAKSVQQPAHSAHLPTLQLKRDIEAQEEHKRADESRKDATEKGQRVHWFPWFAAALHMNFSLLGLSMIYWVFNVENYVTQHMRSFIIAHAIFTVLSLVFSLLWSSPYLSLLKRRRNDTAIQAPISNYQTTLNNFNAFCCFTFVVLYLYHSVLPQHAKPKWQIKVALEENLMLPAFAYLLDTKYHQPVDFLGESCFYTNQSDWLGLPCPVSAMGKTPTRLYFDGLNEIHKGPSTDRLAYIFNSSELPLLGSVVPNEVHLRIYADFTNDTAIEAVLFNPRINLTDAIACGLVRTFEIPSPATNLLYVDAVRFLDPLGMIHAPPSPARCAAFFKDSLSAPGLPHMSFGYNISTTDIVSNISSPGGVYKSAIRPNSISLAYASHTVRTLESTPGIDKLIIWLNCSGIVGAVQVFAGVLQLIGFWRDQNPLRTFWISRPER